MEEKLVVFFSPFSETEQALFPRHDMTNLTWLPRRDFPRLRRCGVAAFDRRLAAPQLAGIRGVTSGVAHHGIGLPPISPSATTGVGGASMVELPELGAAAALVEAKANHYRSSERTSCLRCRSQELPRYRLRLLVSDIRCLLAGQPSPRSRNQRLPMFGGCSFHPRRWRC